MMRDLMFSVIKKASKLGGYGLGKIKPLKVAYDFAFVALQPKMVDVQGHKMFLDPRDKSISRELILKGVYEKFETELIKNLIKPEMNVVDLGANVGYYTLIMARLVDKGKVYAFEPDPTNFSLLKKNVEANGYKNVVLVNKAVSDKSQKVKLYLSEDNLGGHHLHKYGEYKKYTTVNTITLDEFFSKNNVKIDFIKMDIEGSEAAAMKGMKRILKRNKNLKIITEFSPVRITGFGENPDAHLRNLIKNFKVFYINEKNKKLIPVKESYIDEICKGVKVWTNFLLTK